MEDSQVPNVPTDLLHRIEQAFSWRPKPGKEDLFTPPTGCYFLDGDEDGIRAIEGYDWRDLTLDLCETHHDIHSFLPPNAFCYYLPGFLSLAVRESTVDNMISGYIIGDLDRSPTMLGWDGHFEPRYGQLTLAECEVLEAWLWWALDYVEHERREFWSGDDGIANALVTVHLLKERLRGRES